MHCILPKYVNIFLNHTNFIKQVMSFRYYALAGSVGSCKAVDGVAGQSTNYQSETARKL